MRSRERMKSLAEKGKKRKRSIWRREDLNYSTEKGRPRGGKRKFRREEKKRRKKAPPLSFRLEHAKKRRTRPYRSGSRGKNSREKREGGNESKTPSKPSERKRRWREGLRSGKQRKERLSCVLRGGGNTRTWKKNKEFGCSSRTARGKGGGKKGPSMPSSRKRGPSNPLCAVGESQKETYEGRKNLNLLSKGVREGGKGSHGFIFPFCIQKTEIQKKKTTASTGMKREEGMFNLASLKRPNLPSLKFPKGSVLQRREGPAFAQNLRTFWKAKKRKVSLQVREEKKVRRT